MKKTIVICLGMLCIIGCTKTPDACINLPHPSPYKVNESITLNCDCNVGPKGYTNGKSCEWDFGDGTSANGDPGTPVEHKYTTPGTYKLTLKSVNKKKSTSASANMEVIP